jgi:uncharacterized protein YcbK (DUF882 family)
MLGLICAAAAAVATPIVGANAAPARGPTAPTAALPNRPAAAQNAQPNRQQPRRAPPPRRLAIYNVHTGESFNGVYWQNGRYVPAATRRLSVILRDHRSGSVRRIDPRLFDVLSQLSRTLRMRGPFHVWSAYRSPQTNYRMYLQSGAVAQNSFHIRGMAVDVTVPGRSRGILARSARALGAGGVGVYRTSSFIHVDTGPVRTWAY